VVKFVSPAKTAQMIEMPFRVVTLVGPRNHVLDGARSPIEKWHFGGESRKVGNIKNIETLYCEL